MLAMKVLEARIRLKPHSKVVRLLSEITVGKLSGSLLRNFDPVQCPEGISHSCNIKNEFRPP